MNLKSKRTALILLAIVAIIVSRVIFLFINDPEGPNMLVVFGMTAFVYLLSLIAYAFNLPYSKKFWLAISIQILIVIGLSLLL